MARGWGPWTEIKLDALSAYLTKFVTAAKSARGTLYLDLFAGGPDNRLRATGERIEGSTARALACEPPFTKVVAFEKQPQTARMLQEDLGSRYPHRDLEVISGDCNVEVSKYLSRLHKGWRHAPTFAFLDQYGANVHWSTIEVLAGFKHPDRTKVEILMYFPSSFIPRGTSERAPGNEGFEARIDQMFGNRDWRRFKQMRQSCELDGGQYRNWLVNHMRWQLEHDLGYRMTIPLELRNTLDNEIYRLILATDHAAAKRIISHVFGIAIERLDAMASEHKLRRHLDRMDGALGMEGLFAGDVTMAAVPARTQVDPVAPPLPPPWHQAH